MKIKLFFVLSIFYLNAWAQEDAFLSKIFPPSPNAASLGKYAQIPVSNYTGTPNISIPIWNIQLQDFNLPISLSYHASGIRVAENASWVGLGWALKAGGLITRSVVNLADNPTASYYVGPHKIPEQNPDYFFIGRAIGIEDPLIDTEPDIFSFNFNGRTGKFTYDQEGNIHLFPHQDLKVTEGTNSPWGIITEDGTKYNFGQDFIREWSKTRRYVDNGIVYDQEYHNTWYLTSIELPNGDSITFNYSPEYYSYRSGLSKTQKIEKNNPSLVSESHSIYNTYNIKGYYLSSIVWKTGRIEFQASQREDLLEYEDSTKPPVKLDLIKIFDYTNTTTPIKVYELKHGYFGNCSSCSDELKYEKLRLRLDSLTEMSGDLTLKKPPHVFKYDQANTFPSKDSGLADHWGYNGGSAVVQGFNGFLGLNEYSYYYLAGMSHDPLVGNPRIYKTPFNVNSNINKNAKFPAMRAGTLLEIEYPTGGKTIFEYEPHKYAFFINGDTATKVIEKGIQVIGEESSPTTVDTLTLSEFPNAEFTFEMELTCWDPNTHEELDCSDSNAQVNFDLYKDNRVVLLDESNNEVISVKWITGDGGFWLYRNGLMDVNRGILMPDVDGFITFAVDLALDQGSYYLKAIKDAQSPFDVWGWLSYKAEVSITPGIEDQIAGGLRVKRITHFDDTTKVLEKEFAYEKGKLFHKPKYHSAKMEYRQTGAPFVIRRFVFNDWLELNSGNVTTTGIAQGSHIGYEKVKVTEKNIANPTLGNGYSIYSYNNTPFYRNQYSYCEVFDGKEQTNPMDNYRQDFIAGDSYPYPPPLLIDNNLGNLKSVEHFNSGDQKVLEERNNYRLTKIDTVFGLKVIEHPVNFAGSPNGPPDHLVYMGWYQYINSWNALKSTTRITYDVTTGDSLKNLITYEYAGNDHIQVTKTTEENSDSRQRITKVEYPSDNPLNTQTDPTVVNAMVTNNMLFPLVSEVTGEGNSILSGVINNYQIDSGNVVRKNTQIATTNGTYEVRFTYDQHDANGNVLQFIDSKGVVNSIIWGHNQALPIVQGVGVDYTTLKGAYDQVGGNLSILHEQATLSDAQVTTYTYDPLIGMTSQTDPNGITIFYEYDDLNRLKLIKDHEGNILQHYEYHYHSDSQGGAQ